MSTASIIQFGMAELTHNSIRDDFCDNNLRIRGPFGASADNTAFAFTASIYSRIFLLRNLHQ